MEPWLRSDTIALGALLVSLGSFWVSWRVHRRQVAASRPVFSAEAAPLSARPGWWRLVIYLRNQTPYGIKCKALTVKQPWRARILTSQQAYELSANGKFQLRDHLPEQNAKRSVPMSLVAYEANQNAHREELFVRWPGSPPSVLRLKISWHHLDEKQHLKNKALRTTLPAAN